LVFDSFQGSRTKGASEVKKADVKVGSFYRAMVSGKIQVIKITRDRSPDRGFDATNPATGRYILIRSAQRLRGAAPEPGKPAVRIVPASELSPKTLLARDYIPAPTEDQARGPSSAVLDDQGLYQ
jgi:hypothetical protein